MCIICLDWQKGKMTDDEALRALSEMVNIDPESKKPDYHYYQEIDRILDKRAEKSEGGDTEE
jgi:hypothetical protein